jgi:DNA polymerase III delta prime subunit
MIFLNEPPTLLVSKNLPKIAHKTVNYGTYKVDKYLTEIADKFNANIPLFATNRLAITAPTGTGKTTLFLQNNVNLTGKTLFLLPYTSLLEQIQNDYTNETVAIIRNDDSREILEMQLHEIASSEVIKYVVATYDTLPKFENIQFNNIIIDESHELTNAYGYRAAVLAAIWEKIQSNSYNLVLFISATTNPLLCKHFGFDTVKIERNFSYNYTVNSIEYKENLVRSLAIYLCQSYEKGKKIVIELNNIEQINKVKEYINKLNESINVATINSKAERLEKSKEYESILKDSLILCDILLCTKFIEAGVNIKNTDIKEVIYVLNNTKSIDSLKQFAGRFRAMNELKVSIFSKKKENLIDNFNTLETYYNSILDSNMKNCNDCNEILSLGNFTNVTSKQIESEVKRVANLTINPLNINSFIDNKDNDLISSCYYYIDSLQQYRVDLPLVLYKAVQEYQNSFNAKSFIKEVCKDKEYSIGNTIDLQEYEPCFEFDCIAKQSKEKKDAQIEKLKEFAVMNELEFLELLVKVYKADKQLLENFANTCNLDLKRAINAINTNKNVISNEFYFENKEMLRNTKYLEKVILELLELRKYTKTNESAFNLGKRLAIQKLNIEKFNDLVAYYSLKNKEFSARNPKLSIQKEHIKYLCEFVKENDYTVKYKVLISDKKLLRYFQNKPQIEKWCKTLFIVKSSEVGKYDKTYWSFQNREFDSIDSMKNILHF